MATKKSIFEKVKALPWSKIAVGAGLIAVGLLGGAGATFTITAGDGKITAEINTTSKIELTDTTIPATIETEAGTQVVEVPTVEVVDAGEITEEDAQGAWHDTSTPQAYYNSVGLDTCINNAYGAQCFALASDFWSNYAGRALSSCGTGAAKGTLNCYEYNAGSEFEMIWDATQLQPGDWVVFSGGTWGHIGMAMGYYNNGYISLFGQNQGGAYCYGGGAATNVINKSTKDFIGAFRPKSYIVAPTPEPSIPISGCVEWMVAQGDTMSKIMLTCENTVVYGEAMNAYAATWYSRLVKPGQSVYEGWTTGTGYGLYADDIIDHKVGL